MSIWRVAPASARRRSPGWWRPSPGRSGTRRRKPGSRTGCSRSSTAAEDPPARRASALTRGPARCKSRAMTLLPLARAFTVAACALAVGALACESRPAAAECEPSSRSLDAPTALVLSGGGAKGAYEAGVAATLVERGVAIRLVAGSSAGSLFDPAPLRKLIDATLDLDRVRVAPVHLLVVTSDLARREARVFDNRTVTRDVLLAAAAVPGALPAVEVDGTLLVDGGLTGRAPVLEALAAGEPLSRALVVMSYAPGEQGRAPTTMRRALEEAFEMGMIHQIRR